MASIATTDNQWYKAHFKRKKTRNSIHIMQHWSLFLFDSYVMDRNWFCYILICSINIGVILHTGQPLQRSFSFVHKLAIVEKFNCLYPYLQIMATSTTVTFICPQIGHFWKFSYGLLVYTIGNICLLFFF